MAVIFFLSNSRYWCLPPALPVPGRLPPCIACSEPHPAGVSRRYSNKITVSVFFSTLAWMPHTITFIYREYRTSVG